ncbi:hypothetical protein BDU57DRAFT_203044 [Ampelomyces quisqualis]|uniref:Uncharacterized protein n=1 Tax=Ampelomyces quisqualis TaxID=50730 RepID=A0A6A5QT16_AMPQU|nr:hypothetical protein BDU57DRAFT_203044 [Ampelomyces quisqualis]
MYCTPIASMCFCSVCHLDRNALELCTTNASSSSSRSHPSSPSASYCCCQGQDLDSGQPNSGSIVIVLLFAMALALQATKPGSRGHCVCFAVGAKELGKHPPRKPGPKVRYTQTPKYADV